jgi:hypothetical protein
LLQKTVLICVLVAIFALIFRVGDLSADACNFLQDRLFVLGITVQQN